MAEAYQLDERQIDQTAAYFLEHMGGIGPDQISDINQYSQVRRKEREGRGA